MIFVDRMWFAGPIFVIFLLDRGINFTQVGLITWASYIVSFLLDIPSSIWTDRYSRRSLLTLSSAAFTLLNITFWMFFLGFCFNGTGTAFSSGISSAFLYNTLLSMGKERKYEKVQAKIVQYSFVGRIIASVAGVYLYYMNPKLPFLLSAVANFICFLGNFFPHEAYSREERQ